MIMLSKICATICFDSSKGLQATIAIDQNKNTVAFLCLEKNLTAQIRLCRAQQIFTTGLKSWISKCYNSNENLHYCTTSATCRLNNVRNVRMPRFSFVYIRAIFSNFFFKKITMHGQSIKRHLPLAYTKSLI